MELKIIGKKEEPLLSRTEIKSEIIFEKATPSKEEVKAVLAKGLGKDSKLIVISEISSKFGSKKASCLSYVYENEDLLKRIDPLNSIKPEEKKEKAGDKAADKKEEKEPVKKDDKAEAKAKTKKGDKPAETKSEKKDEKAK